MRRLTAACAWLPPCYRRAALVQCYWCCSVLPTRSRPLRWGSLRHPALALDMFDKLWKVERPLCLDALAARDKNRVDAR